MPSVAQARCRAAPLKHLWWSRAEVCLASVLRPLLFCVPCTPCFWGCLTQLPGMNLAASLLCAGIFMMHYWVEWC